MSLDLFRQKMIDALTDAQSQYLEAATAMLPNMVKSADEYAMTQVDRLAFARAMTFARATVNDVFKKLTQPEEKVAEPAKVKQKGAVY